MMSLSAIVGSIIAVVLVIALIFVGLTLPREHWIVAKVAKTDCTQGFSTDPRVVLEKSGIYTPYYISKGWCDVATILLNQTVNALINGQENTVLQLEKA